jgi:hypothetical protein
MLVNNELDFLIHCIHDWLWTQSKSDMYRQPSLDDTQLKEWHEERKKGVTELLAKLEAMKDE